MSQINRGVYVTMVTPFNSDGGIDYGAVRELVGFYAKNGCDGIFAACQSSEIFFLSLEERVKLTQTVVDAAAKLKAHNGGRLTIVASGHVSDAFSDQSTELNAIAETHPDALVLISNRLDIANTDEAAWISDCGRLLDALPDSMPLGVYECPYPYKRLLTDNMILHMAKTGRFAFTKDTCCDAALIKRRLSLTAGSDFGQFNANAQTLLSSLRDGGAGYCGVMANFHPALYRRLYDAFTSGDNKTAEFLQSLACITAFTESMCYPVTAKYHLSAIESINMTINTRSRDISGLTDYQKDCVRQMKTLVDRCLSELN